MAVFAAEDLGLVYLRSDLGLSVISLQRKSKICERRPSRAMLNIIILKDAELGELAGVGSA